MEEKDEYKKRIRDLAERLEKNQEKNKDESIGEQQVIEAKERLLQTVKSKINPDFRNEKILMVFTYTIRDYYRQRAVPTEKNQFQEEIDALYKLIYEELRKPNVDISVSQDKHEKKRILKKMVIILGLENIFRDFYKHYKKDDILRPNSLTKEIIWCIFTVIGGISVISYFYWYYFIYHN